MSLSHRSWTLATFALLATLSLAGCGDSAKPVPVKNVQAPPPYAHNGIDAVGVGRDPSHHSPFGATDGAEVGTAQPQKKP